MSLGQFQITTPEQVSLKHQLAGLGSRATAQLLDWLILSVCSFALSFGVIFLSAFFRDLKTDLVRALLLLILFILIWGYFILFEFFMAGRTPGKRLVGLRVIQDNGQPLTFLGAAVRNLLRIIDFLPSLFLLGILLIFLHPRHKRMGDLAAGTLVVYQRKPKRSKKKNPLEQEMERKLIANPLKLELDDWTLRKFTGREWTLLDTYIKRTPSLLEADRKKMTLQVAEVFYPLLGQETANQPLEQIENTLYALYLLLKQEWQFEA